MLWITVCMIVMFSLVFLRCGADFEISKTITLGNRFSIMGFLCFICFLEESSVPAIFNLISGCLFKCIHGVVMSHYFLLFKMTVLINHLQK